MFPKYWIYFGTLHCIALASFVGLCFVKVPKISLFFGFAILFLHFTPYRLPWIKLHPSLDYFPFFPWFSYTLLGIGSILFPWYKFSHRILKFSLFKGFAFLGKKALIIYLLHQPILYGILFLIKKLY